MENQEPFGTGSPVPPPPSTGSAKDQLKLPAIFLIILGALGACGSLLGLVQAATGANEAAMAEVLSNPDVPEWTKNLAQMSGTTGLIFNVISLAIAAFIIYAGTRMLKLEKFGVSMAGSILAAIPCIGPCVCLAVPFGIWALVVLNKPDVKGAFTS